MFGKKTPGLSGAKAKGEEHSIQVHGDTNIHLDCEECINWADETLREVGVDPADVMTSGHVTGHTRKVCARVIAKRDPSLKKAMEATIAAATHNEQAHNGDGAIHPECEECARHVLSIIDDDDLEKVVERAEKLGKTGLAERLQKMFQRKDSAWE